jgi:glycosyltransferase involved in cell wall biosynthesis
MIGGKRVCVVMPAYNAEKTLERTAAELDRDVADDIIVVDDASRDRTSDIARRLGLHLVVHERNRGYGGNQKTCYTEALARGADIVVMVHPDYQYSPRLLAAMAGMVASEHFDAVLGSRILGTGARRGYKLSEYHSGYRAFSRRLLERLPLEENSDDFVFDNQMLAQTLWFGFDIGELTCPTRYLPEASSINFRRSVKYGFGVLGTAIQFRLARMGLAHPRRLSDDGRRLALAALPER